MPCCSVIGSYDDRCAYILIDSSCSTSCVSNQFVRERKLGITVQNISQVAYSTCFAPIRVPTIGGAYTSRFRIPVRSLVKFDVLLGADWVKATGAIVSNDGLTLALPSPECLQSLADGHSWKDDNAPDFGMY
jgi:hypothetical protein